MNFTKQMLAKQLIVYILLAYGISWAIWFPLYANAIGLNFSAEIPFNHALGGLGPLLAAIISTAIFTGRKGLKQLFRKVATLPHASYFLIALLAPTVLLVVALLADHLVNNTGIDVGAIFRSKEFPSMNFLGFFFYNLFFFGFGEEVGWRGFVQPRIQSKTNALLSGIVVTVIWAAWHIPLFLYRPGYTGMDIAGITGWFFSLFTGSLLLTWLYNSNRGSILICAIFHTTIDLAFTSQADGKDTNSFLGAMITLWGIVVWLLYKSRNLSKSDAVTWQKL